MLSFYSPRINKKKDKVKMKSHVNYLISITERINISYIKRLKLVGRDTDEAPIFQQHSQSVSKHKLGIKDQKEEISYFSKSPLISLADMPKAIEVE